MDFKTLKEVFEHHSNVQGDEELANNIIKFVQRFKTKNEVHIAFFGGNLFGVHNPRFTNSDVMDWIEEVMLIDDMDACQEDIYSVPDINKKWVVSSSIVNQSFIYALHVLYQSDINDRLKERALYDAMAMFLIKFATKGLYTRFRKFKASEGLAMALYESLDNKTDLKNLGTWDKWFIKKAETILSEDFWRVDAWRDYTNTYHAIQFANEVRGAVEKAFNLLMEKMMILYRAGEGISSTGSFTNIDGEEVLKDIRNKTRARIEDMRDIAREPSALIKDELVTLVSDVVSTTNTTILANVLNYYSDNFRANKDYSKLIEKTMLVMVELSRSRRVDMSNIPAIIEVLRKALRNSQIKDENIKEIKSIASDIVDDSREKAREATITGTRVALVIYIALRALAMDHYR